MRKSILLILSSLIILSIMFNVSAADEQPFKIDKYSNLTITCINNGSYCSSAATCAITVDLNGKNIINDQAMINNGSYHYYQQLFSETGEYDYVSTCTDNGKTSYIQGTFRVSPSGFFDNFWFIVFIIAFLFILIAFGYAIQNIWIAVLASYGLMIISIYTRLNGFGMFRDSTTDIVSYIILAFAAIISITLTLELIQDNL